MSGDAFDSEETGDALNSYQIYLYKMGAINKLIMRIILKCQRKLCIHTNEPSFLNSYKSTNQASA